MDRTVRKFSPEGIEDTRLVAVLTRGLYVRTWQNRYPLGFVR